VLFLIILLPLLVGTTLTGWSGARRDAGHRARTAWLAAAVTASSFGLLLAHAGPVMAGEDLHWFAQWVPEIGLNLNFRLDGLSFMFALMITGIGLLIILYAHFYLGEKDPAGKFFSTMMLFMAGMLGVVLSDNLMLLVVFWELTSISSFLLVGYWNHKPEARAGARVALAVTGGGGLALLAGVVILAQIAQTYEFSAMVALAPTIRADSRYPMALVLILLGCFTKSAQFPFHFWLPQAMAAPTPVSAYLHSATMVKAGLFVMARMTPVLGGTELFALLVMGTGLVTVTFAAVVAIFKHDIKALLAYSTISHLGLITFLIGLGSPLAAVAALFHTLNHASFKGALFMTAGIVDHESGTRDLRRLGGLAHFMPWTATLAMVAAAAMAGVPFFNGFVSKEMFLTEAVAFSAGGGWRWLVPAFATLAALASVAYSVRLVHGLFFNGPPRDLPEGQPHDPPLGMRAPVILLAAICVVVGVLPALTAGPLVRVAATAMVGHALPQYHLALWHGLNLPLALSMTALVGGALLYFFLARDDRLHRRDIEAFFGRLAGMKLFTRGSDALLRTAGQLTFRLENASLQRYLAVMLAATVGIVAAILLWGDAPGTGGRAQLPASLPATVGWAVLVTACGWLLLGHRQRFESVVATGAVGLVAALGFVALSAPDLALTQLTVDIVSTILLLMGLALLPQSTPRESSKQRRSRDVALAVAGGAGIGWLAWVMLTRDHQSISWYFLQQAVPGAGGTNVVNVILVDFRGYDTFGEITVLAIAAVGVLAMMDGMRVHRSGTDSAGRGWTFAAQPLMLRVAAQLVLPLALVVSLYIFMRGHNLPGGGFIAGLVTAVALLLQYMAQGRPQAEGLLHARGGLRFVHWIAIGLSLAVLTGLGAFAFGRPFLTSAHGHPHLPLLGDLPLASAALFDLGVYVTVVGATLLMLATLAGASRAGAATAAPVRSGVRP
jgi:multicomponent K+:H+ antiporter subunit A